MGGKGGVTGQHCTVSLVRISHLGTASSFAGTACLSSFLIYVRSMCAKGSGWTAAAMLASWTLSENRRILRWNCTVPEPFIQENRTLGLLWTFRALYWNPHIRTLQPPTPIQYPHHSNSGAHPQTEFTALTLQRRGATVSILHRGTRVLCCVISLDGVEASRRG